MDSTLGRGMDLAIVTALFLGLGYLVDRWLGTKPWMMIVFVVLALVGEFVRIKAHYLTKMAELDAQRAETARSRSRGAA